MHGEVSRRDRDERGAVLVMVALFMTLLMVAAAFVLDLGLVRVDRQIDKSAADSATLAGLHALNAGDGYPHSYIGVCTAAQYLQRNSGRFAGVDTTTGWKNGLGAASTSGCTDASLRKKACKPTDKSTWAVWTWSGESGGASFDIKIESGYTFTGSGWTEDSLPASSSDTGLASQAGCDQLAITITQSRTPGLGSLATESDLVTSIRSVGRVKAQPGDSAPALLLLKQTGCPVLRTGSNSGDSYVHVFGAVSNNGISQPGTIHSDGDGVGCTGGSNSNVFIGGGGNGIVAFAGPLVSNPTSPDPSKPGLISSVALTNGLSGTVIRDSLDNVHGSTALTTGGTSQEVVGRSLVTRRLVDERYFTGVKGAISAATGVFATGATGPITGWTKFPASVDACKPTPAQVTALSLTSASRLYVDCNGKFIGDTAGLTLDAGTIYFRGWLNPARTLRMPNATKVYIGNHVANASAIDLGNNASVEVNNNAANLGATGLCGSGQSSSKATLFVRSGVFKQTGGLLRLCRTTTFMMGGSSTGCVPTTSGTPPTAAPCPGINSGRGYGQFTQTGGDIDWTAPDSVDATLDPSTMDPLPGSAAAWSDINGPEDLALWAESGTNSSDTYNMTGGGIFNVRGIFMTPNAEPFILSGGALLNLTNAQYICSSLELNGAGTRVLMKVDPNSAVTLPDLGLVGLVR
ncbi:hypothetical protein GCM10009843_06330 [Nocardioides bigeumensis]|uniref:Flp pilus-assembly TadG-like N-terminal domain-containing protein n=1 Tax=Nocardioides bigeumensis TaxID=433657 RepID=A0ABN2XS29_9ACTN